MTTREPGAGGNLEFPFPPSVNVDTSRVAAAAIAPAARSLRLRVLRVVAQRGGATCEEVCLLLGLDGNTVRPRLWELERAGVITKSDLRVPTRSGGKARAYRVLDAAAAEALLGPTVEAA
jgi:predicted transcriptional regulator